MACTVGACNVEAADALSGVCTWDETLQRVQAGWAWLPVQRSEEMPTEYQAALAV